MRGELGALAGSPLQAAALLWVVAGTAAHGQRAVAMGLLVQPVFLGVLAAFDPATVRLVKCYST